VAVDRAVLFRLATSERLEWIVKAVPGGDALAWRAAARYVAGRSRDEALSTTADLLAHGHGVSVDLFGELVRDPATAERVTEDYLVLAAALPDPPADVWLSLDLSHLAIDTDPSGATDRLATIAAALPPGRRIQVGAEDAARTDAVLGCVLGVAGRGLADQVGATVQANLLRSERDVDTLTAAGVHVRLVKGAYLEPAGTHRTGNAPTSPTSGSGSACTQPGRHGRWLPTTVDCGKRCCWRSARCRSSSCSECDQRHSPSSRHNESRPVSTSRTDPTGSATGSAGSPNLAAPDAPTRASRRATA